MGARRSSKPDDKQGDLFAAGELFPVRRRTEGVRTLDLSLKIKTALGQALRESADKAHVIASRMSDLIGREITPDALYAYTAPSKPEHEISLIRFVAFVRVTGATWLYDVLVEDEGLIVMEGEEARFAHLGLLRQQHSQLVEQLEQIEREMKERPVKVTRRRPEGSR
ncbi:MAG: hypothetical protein AB7U62_19190 [Pseudolabrys sp.]